MPRYSFRLTNGKEVLKTQQPLELPGNAAARDEALVLARELRDGKAMPGRKWDGWFVEVVDSHGHKIDSVPIAVVPDDASPPLFCTGSPVVTVIPINTAVSGSVANSPMKKMSSA